MGATLIAATLALCGSGGVGYSIVSIYFRRDNPPVAATMKVGGEILKFPASYLRVEARPREDSGSVELAAFFPQFGPAGQIRDVTARTDLDERFERTVFISVQPADAGLDPSERTARLYQRFLEDTSWTQPGGLIARAFQAGSPFEGDELYYVSPEGRQFAARCRRPEQTRGAPNTCMAVFRSGRLDVGVRFSAALLSEWEKLMTGVRGLIESARR